MSFLGDTDLKLLITRGQLIKPYKEERVQSGSYELSLGDQYYSTGEDGKLVKFLSDKNKHIVIHPGQFALLLTEEFIEIPNDKIAFISIKASIKFSGLVNISGFHVDPGFKGHLKFSVYNAGPASIILEWQRPCFIIWFSQLTNPLSTNDLYKGVHQNQVGITVDDLNKLKGELASPGSLLQKLKKIQREIDYAKAITTIVFTIIATNLIGNFFTNKQTINTNNSTFINDSTLLEKKINRIVSKRLDSLYKGKQLPENKIR